MGNWFKAMARLCFGGNALADQLEGAAGDVAEFRRKFRAQLGLDDAQEVIEGPPVNGHTNRLPAAKGKK